MKSICRPIKISLLVTGFVFIQIKSLAAPPKLYREIAPNDSSSILSPNAPLETNLDKLYRDTKSNMALEIKPWANRSWKLNSGLIATRYASTDFMNTEGWENRRRYAEEHSIKKILSEPDAKTRARMIDLLSPAEKYDLLVGDPQTTLTQAQWLAGEKYWADKTMANWMGICEGSAAASALFPEPLHAVDFETSTGDVVRFHVLDIKALAALLWSSYNADIPISGSRCASNHPKSDRDGIVVDEDCFNSNPASLHIALLNFLGRQHRTFFVNRVTSVQVWNVPILEYQVSYYKPTANKLADSLDEAKIPAGEYHNDPFATYRSPQTANIVAVKMKIKIAKGMTSSRDNPETSATSELSYLYDLELDAQGQIIGGEWHQQSHVDFMWAVEADFHPTTIGDVLLGKATQWDGKIVPEIWLKSIQQASSRNQPLEKIVTKLIELSRQ
jgi:hypothetical protein